MRRNLPRLRGSSSGVTLPAAPESRPIPPVSPWSCRAAHHLHPQPIRRSTRDTGEGDRVTGGHERRSAQSGPRPAAGLRRPPPPARTRHAHNDGREIERRDATQSLSQSLSDRLVSSSVVFAKALAITLDLPALLVIPRRGGERERRERRRHVHLTPPRPSRRTSPAPRGSVAPGRRTSPRYGTPDRA